jgi:hypothetical protein
MAIKAMTREEFPSTQIYYCRSGALYRKHQALKN